MFEVTVWWIKFTIIFEIIFASNFIDESSLAEVLKSFGVADISFCLESKACSLAERTTPNDFRTFASDDSSIKLLAKKYLDNDSVFYPPYSNKSQNYNKVKLSK